MKVKILSNGTPIGTHVYNSETGEEIHGITKLILTATPFGVFAEVTVRVTSVDVMADEKIVEKERA